MSYLNSSHTHYVQAHLSLPWDVSQVENFQDGVTICGTSALEVGVDIMGLNVCVDSDVPADRMGLLQRIGRVGRNANHPAVVVLVADRSKPCADALLADPCRYLSAAARHLVLPLQTEATVLAMLACCLQEEVTLCQGGARASQISPDWWQLLQDHLSQHSQPDVSWVVPVARPGPGLKHSDVEDMLLARFCDVIGASCEEIKDKQGRWCFAPFRDASCSGMIQGNRVPLVQYDLKPDDTLWPRRVRVGGQTRLHHVAWIDRMRLFTVAHPEGVFLGHDGHKYTILSHTMRVPKRAKEWQRLKNEMHGSVAQGNERIADASAEGECIQCSLMISARGLNGHPVPSPRSCPYRTIHLPNDPLDHICRRCLPLDAAGNLQSMEHCPLRADLITPCPSGKWLSYVEEVRVKRVGDHEKATVGVVGQPTFTRLQVCDGTVCLPDGHPTIQQVRYHRWRCEVAWAGYRQGNSSSGAFHTAEDVEGRMCGLTTPKSLQLFGLVAIDRPFTTPISYNTSGLEWTPVAKPRHAENPQVCITAAYIIRYRMCSVLACEPGQLFVDMGKLDAHQEDGGWSVRIIDASPGGSGRSWAALARGGVFGSLGDNHQPWADMLRAWTVGRTSNAAAVNLMDGFGNDNEVKARIQDVRSQDEENALGHLQNSNIRRDTSEMLHDLYTCWQPTWQSA